MVLRCVCRITSARKQRRICADKKIDYFAAFQKIFCSVTASSETTDSDKKAFARDENKKKQTSRVISQRRSRQMHERKVSLGY